MNRKTFLLAVLLGCLSMATATLAQNLEAPRSAAGPAEVITDVTQRVMELVAEANTYFDQDPDRYFEAIDQVLADLVDWRGFATAVMGDYYSRGRSLDPRSWTNIFPSKMACAGLSFMDFLHHSNIRD